MSLIGSLEDLSLGDILQIIYLSQKSGVLVIRSEDGEGRIVFRDGLVCGGHLSGGPIDLRGLLVGGGFVAEGAFDRTAEHCDSEGEDLEEALAKQDLITLDAIGTLRREHVESVVTQLFRWKSGEFSFDLQRESEESELLLAEGINPQFLAMEGVRLDDESAREAEFEDDVNDMSAEEMFGVVADPEPEAPGEAVPIEDGDSKAVGSSAETDRDPSEATAEAAVAPPAAGPFARGSRPPIVAIDSDLEALEWMKRALKDHAKPIHIFQRADLGLTRIRQYLARGMTPTVLVSPGIEGDPIGGIADASDFAKRLQVQAPSMPVVWLCEDGGVAPPAAHPASGRLVHPAARAFRSRGSARMLDDLARKLCEDFARITGIEPQSTPPQQADASGPAPVEASAAASSDRSQEMTRELNDAAARGEVLLLMIRFARQSFDRVAMFKVRGERVIGVAQSGLEETGGPDDQGMRALSLEGSSSSWLRSVLASKESRVSPPEDEGDFQLAAQLGDRVATEAYLAPICAADEIVALLYADNLSGGRPIGDTETLDATLRQAGLALERAANEQTQTLE